MKDIKAGSKIKMFFEVFLTIFRSSDLVKSRFSIAFYFVKLWLRYTLYYKVLDKTINEEELFGFTLKTGDYEIFFKLFIDIFIKNQYFFESRRKNPRIVDGGAHIGLSLVYFKLLYPESQVTCVEPDPDIFELLRTNVKVNELTHVQLYNFALGEMEGRKPFLKGESKKSWSSRVLYEQKGPQENILFVPTRRLSRLIDGTLDLLKLDIEGSESEVMQELDRKSVV